MDAATKPLLIIFYRNPRYGAVKTRLAATLGNKKALNIFNKLALHSRDVTIGLGIDKMVFYSDNIETDDIWTESAYFKAVQNGDDLGERMKNAFVSAFRMSYDQVCIIGTDCYELTSAIIENAFESLRSADAVIGPAQDGGYYLLGMRQLYPEVFSSKQWGTSNVFGNTVCDFESLGISYTRLQTLRDVDVESDLPESWKRI